VFLPVHQRQAEGLLSTDTVAGCTVVLANVQAHEIALTSLNCDDSIQSFINRLLVKLFKTNNTDIA